MPDQILRSCIAETHGNADLLEENDERQQPQRVRSNNRTRSFSSRNRMHTYPALGNRGEQKNDGAGTDGKSSEERRWERPIGIEPTPEPRQIGCHRNFRAKLQHKDSPVKPWRAVTDVHKIEIPSDCCSWSSSSPANFNAARMSSLVWSYSRCTSSKPMPPARLPTTMDTGVRVPRITGLSRQIAGSMVIRFVHRSPSTRCP